MCQFIGLLSESAKPLTMSMYYCGWNGCGQISGYPSRISTPTCLTFDGPIISVSCSWSIMSVATDKSLTVMGFIGNRSRANQQISLANNCTAVDVSSCLHRTLIAGNTGKCYEYKADTDTLRQLVGFTTTEPSSEEAGCSEVDPIIKVRCSDYCNLALSKSGKVFSIPSLVSHPGLVVTDVSCGNEHCVLLTTSGTVYTWGSGSRGQLGHWDLEPEENPRLVDALAGIPVRSISAGAWHNAVVTCAGDLYTWGWGSDGQLGNDEQEVKESKDFEENECPIGAKRRKIDPQSSLMEDGGDNYRGIVQAYPVPVNTPSDVDLVSCGTRHTVVLLVDGSVWGCGWNAYGQLACSPDNYGRVTGLKQIIIPGLRGRVSKVQCGGWSSCFIA